MKDRRPYLLRAMIEWIVDSGCTPYVVLAADAPGVEVPREHVEQGRIVLNVSAHAVGHFNISDDELSLSCRFGGVSRNIRAPLAAVAAVFARENGEGMVFEPDALATGEAASGSAAAGDSAQDNNRDSAPADGGDGPAPTPPKGGPGLRVVK